LPLKKGNTCPPIEAAAAKKSRDAIQNRGAKTMKISRSTMYTNGKTLLPWLVLVGLPGLVSAACTTQSTASRQDLATSRSSLFANGSFETGAAGAAPPSWTVSTFLNPGVTYPPAQRADLNLSPGGTAFTTILSTGAGAESQVDPTLGATASLRWPKYGNQVAITNRLGKNKNVNALAQTMTISAADIDGVDGKPHVRFVVAPVLQNPAHTPEEQPYYWVELTNLTTGATVYRDYNASAQPGIPWKTNADGTVYYTDWQLVDITSKPGATISMGDQVQLEVIAAGCSLGGHWGQVYVDGVGSTIPGLFVSGSGPASVAAGGNLTYTLTYTNGGSSPLSGVVVELNTPPGATFASLAAAGLTCTAPAVGAAGTVTCAVPGSVAAGASGSFTITVKVDAGAAYGSTVVEGNFDTYATGVSPLLGNKILTTVGCSADAQCGAGNWCSISTITCQPTLANGVAVPSDPPHAAPTLNGVCGAGVGALVCTSAVCDAADSKCGYGVGAGPCTTGNAGTVCRSGACSASGTCMPAGGCNVDVDCSGGQWCAEATHTCTAKIANGGSLPTDPPHTAPTLDGSCGSAAASLVCASAVCDAADSKCGYGTGAGPCTAGTAATVCRSAACSISGTCIPAGGCAVDGDCATATQWCNISTATCTAKIPNGGGMPTDAGHGAAPTLNGKCSAPAATLVCQAAICDSGDDKCGLANGTVCASNAQCRNEVCFSEDGKCGKPVGQACSAAAECRSNDCSAAGVCDADTDGDGVSDATEAALGTDPTKKDTDGDGVPDNIELSATGSGAGPFSKVDTDGDGTIDALDTDDDGDSILTKDELGRDTDADGKNDYLDADDDGDGIPTKKEIDDAKSSGKPSDTDGDGKANWLDTDSDGDNVLDKDEASDKNGDGVPDYLEPPSAAAQAARVDLDPGGSLEGGACSAGTTGASDLGGMLPILGMVGASLLRRRRNRRD